MGGSRGNVSFRGIACDAELCNISAFSSKQPSPATTIQRAPSTPSFMAFIHFPGSGSSSLVPPSLGLAAGFLGLRTEGPLPGQKHFKARGAPLEVELPTGASVYAHLSLVRRRFSASSFAVFHAQDIPLAQHLANSVPACRLLEFCFSIVSQRAPFATPGIPS